MPWFANVSNSENKFICERYKESCCELFHIILLWVKVFKIATVMCFLVAERDKENNDLSPFL